MDFQDVVRLRRMVRDFSTAPVAAETVDLALRNAVRAPNAGFSQGWAFLVLAEPQDVERFWSVTTEPEALAEPGAWLAGMMRAPVLILPCSSKAAYLDRYAEADKGWYDRSEERWAMPYWHLDTAMAALLILLTAVNEGLGGCFFGIPPSREQAVRLEFALPDDHDPIGVIALGHPAHPESSPDSPASAVAGSPSRRPRRPMSEVIHRGTW